MVSIPPLVYGLTVFFFFCGGAAVLAIGFHIFMFGGVSGRSSFLIEVSHIPVFIHRGKNSAFSSLVDSRLKLSQLVPSNIIVLIGVVCYLFHKKKKKRLSAGLESMTLASAYSHEAYSL